MGERVVQTYLAAYIAKKNATRALSQRGGWLVPKQIEKPYVNESSAKVLIFFDMCK